jgi:DNA-damage-inducible protein D
MPLLGYSRWQDFKKAMERATVACINCGHRPEENFRSAPEVFGRRGPGAEDVRLSRFAAYLVARQRPPATTAEIGSPINLPAPATR